ncbi:uncharacterized protein LOC114341845 isoform X2 [Diabrotica virgifera virgifera]|uniref:Uncharacterized protein LOC114341845 isoform X2 n=1 Tax=Diabrotica virgifera virgifera TaxID=50390 RepID=A0A6P7GFM7_DIAVI|nr:uncharacterized protein LOC114341845 isoform X2 [Diabrotica virgifera virgifera]
MKLGVTTAGPNHTNEVYEGCLKNKSIDAYHFNQILIFPLMPPAELLRLRCSAKPYFEECVDVGNNDIRECLNSTVLEGLKVWKQIDKEISEQVCQPAVIEFLANQTNGLSECDKKLKEVFNVCSRKIGNPDANSIEIFNIPQTRGYCKKIAAYESCVTDSLPSMCEAVVKNTLSKVISSIRRNICDVPL